VGKEKMTSLERRHRNLQIRNAVGCLMTLITPIAFCALLLWLPQLYNNWQLSRFANNLFDYPLPPQTEVISRHVEVGLMGNGNHCDFVATQIMRTKLAAEEIEAYYNKVLLPPVNNHNEGIAEPFQGSPIPIFIDFENSALEDGWQYFSIELFDFGYAPVLDFRCH
jgi:hypothetical protein